MVNDSVLFRGKSTETGKWVYGYYVYSKICDKHTIHTDLGLFAEVDQDTVGQYVGFCDKNGKKIFGGDILDTPRWVVTYLANLNAGLHMNAGWYTQRDDFESWCELECERDHVVLGNVWDNPGLMKK